MYLLGNLNEPETQKNNAMLDVILREITGPWVWDSGSEVSSWTSEQKRLLCHLEGMFSHSSHSLFPEWFPGNENDEEN